MPTYNERQALAIEFADDIARMRRCLSTTGKHVMDDDIVFAWADYSDSFCASWLILPDVDQDLLAILQKHLPPSPMAWQVLVEDAGDGTGDGFIVLPADLLSRLRWTEGDVLESVSDLPGSLILRRRE